MARDYLTQDELLEQARELGLDISKRTLKFYTTRGLVPKPEKKPKPDKKKAGKKAKKTKA